MKRASQAVERWFGPGFVQLHPLLQQLHRDGGTLSGRIAITYGSGVAGWLGRRMATRLGLPPHSGSAALSVRIRSDSNALYWSRAFNGGAEVTSIFVPAGSWPDGYWTEQIGALRLVLRMDTSAGGWRWIPLQTSLWGLPLPRHLAPRLIAGKRVENGQYHFSVALSHPMLGALFSYSGVLAPD
jgi:hypothetical protein